MLPAVKYKLVLALKNFFQILIDSLDGIVLDDQQRDIESSVVSLEKDHLTSTGNDVIVDELCSTFELNATLRNLVMCARKSLSTSDARDVVHVMKTVIDAHMSTCLYTAEKVAIGLVKYEASVAGKPAVS